MLTVLSNLLVALVVLGIIIVIHEAGHFFVAKLFKIRVETFSVGFGPRLFGVRYGETDYRLSALPLGGYVKMSGENPGDEVTGDPNEFVSKPRWQRFLVAFAGPAMNGLLAVVLLAGLYMYGIQTEQMPEDTSVGIVVEGSAADAAGIEEGDLIVEFDDMEEFNWRDIELEVITSPERPIPVRLQRGEELIETTLTPIRRGVNEIGDAGWSPSRTGPRVVRFLNESTPAERAGMLVEDEIIAVGATDLRISPRPISELIRDIPSETVQVTVLREVDGEQQTIVLDVMPEEDESGQRLLGVEILSSTVLVKLGPLDALQASLRENAANTVLIFDILGKLITRETSMRSMDGPIGIVRATGQSFQRGIPELIYLMVIISLNLGVINLFPIPILDGGVMLLLAVEGIMRQDLSLAVKERIAQVSFVFLLTVIVFVLYNDVVKLMPQS
jgi:regulator of sigma E protease